MNYSFFDAAMVSHHHALGWIPDLGVQTLLTKHAPRLFCYQEIAGLLWVNLVTDSIIAASYATLFSCLILITVRLRKTSQVRRYLWVFLSFGLFIAACGGTHLMDVINLWWPHYPLATAIRIVCALASLPTALLFASVTPSIIRNIRHYIVQFRSMEEQRDAAKDALLAKEALELEREQAKLQLIALNEHLTSVMNSTSDSILQISYDWEIVYGNQRALASLPGVVVGGNLWACFSELHASQSGENIRDAMAQRIEKRYESYYLPHGIWRMVRVFPTPEGISIFAKDITEEKKLHEALVLEKLRREEHIESLGHMAGGLAHEISNPLAIIHARASDLAESAASDLPPSTSDVLAACHSIVRTSDRAIRILRGLKGLARQAENDPMEYANLASTCDQCLELQHSRLERHHIAVRLYVQADLPLVLCRETQVGQIVANLLSNAFDAMLHDSDTEHWISLDLSRQGDYFSLKIANSGEKIPDEIRRRLMEPFFTTKKFGLGTGVGLSLSRAIALDHGGSLALLGGTEDTCFELLLPCSGKLAEETRDQVEPY